MEEIPEQKIGEVPPDLISAKPTPRTNLKKASKRLGEVAEAAFLSKATALGFGISKPWGDSERYDFIVDVNGRVLRVQVKSAHRVSKNLRGGYHIDGGHARYRGRTRYRAGYTADEIDILVAYIVPEDTWYIFPPSRFEAMGGICIVTDKKRPSKFHQYCEAWNLFREVIPKTHKSQ